jgi:hypothetical protein
MKNQSNHIASTILKQIRVLDRVALMCYGAKNFKVLQESKQFQGGVQFSVTNLRHKGSVKIQLSWVDDYTVTFLNTKNNEVKEFTGVYCDILVGVLNWMELKQ